MKGAATLILPRARAIVLISISALFATEAPAFAQTTYAVRGMDSFTLGSDDQRGDITYQGSETLSTERRASGLRFTVRARYERVDQGAKSGGSAVFVEDILADGSSRDVDSSDPDFLTILNQPFSVRLDPEAMRALRALSAAVPFDFPAPMVGASVRGTLRHGGDGLVSGRPAVGITFAARGPMNGRLPGQAVQLAGQLTLASRAFYDASTAMLVALEVHLEIDGHLAGDTSPEPVKIVYWRSIRIQ